MSKFRVNVCLPAAAGEDVKAALAEAMAPFDMNLSPDFNPNATWDWWRIDAGVGERFAVRPAHDGDARLIHGDPNDGCHPREPLRCDGGPRGMLDFDATRREALTAALNSWEAQQLDFQRLVADHPPARPLTDFLARHAADPDTYPREQAVADHHAQPLIRALNHRSVWDRYPGLGIWVLGPDTDPITAYTQDPQPAFARAETWSIARPAMLTLDGEWVGLKPYDWDRQGEDDADAYARRSTAYLDGLDGDCIIVRLLCHC